MLHVHVGEDLHVRSPQERALPQQPVGDAPDQTLVGQAGAAEDVDADEPPARGVGHGQRPAGIVSQNVDSEGKVDGAADLGGQDRHVGQHVAGNGAREERGVAEVLQQQPVHTPLREGLGIAQDEIAHAPEIAPVARRPGKRRRVQHADHGHCALEPAVCQGLR